MLKVYVHLNRDSKEEKEADMVHKINKTLSDIFYTFNRGSMLPYKSSNLLFPHARVIHLTLRGYRDSRRQPIPR